MMSLRKTMIEFLSVSILATAFAVPSQGGTSYVWWEGENPVETNFPQKTWFSSSSFPKNRHLLSESEWLTNNGNRTGDEAFAKYRVEVPQDGEYDFWVRKFWKHGPFRWRFDANDWRTCPRDVALADNVVLMESVPANWVSLGKVELTKGRHDFELRLLAQKGESLTACFDCFVLTSFPFIPRGALKPDEKSGQANEGFFPWEPDPDPFTQEALFDLRSMNEKSAGENGFVKRDGLNFVLGNGQRVKFWAVNASSTIAGLDRQSIDYLARRLAKSGVNMVRYHSPVFVSGNPMEIDEQKLDDLFYFVTALKREGIYTFLSFYFPLWFDIRPNYGISGFDTTDNKIPFTLLFFNSRMQEFHRAWLRALLSTPNPYTGKTLAKEPAAAIVEIQNEDSFFFWTLSKKNIPSVHWQALERLYGKWLIERYGSLNQAFAAWGKRESGDNVSENRAVLYEAWNMTGGAVQNYNAAMKRRVGDQVRFLTELQRGFYTETIDFIRNELGSGSLISAGNWHVSDPVMLDALERYTYTAGDVIDRHGYFSGPHSSSDGTHSYSVREGHTFGNKAAVTVPESLPLQFIQIDGFPHTISEIGWTNPNLYRADYSFLTSAYGSLQGVDGIFAFAVGSAYWDTSMSKFALTSPAIVGNFPAYALMYRRGDIRESDDVVYQVLDLEDLYALKGGGGATAQNLDAFREGDVPAGGAATGAVNNVDPLAYFVGRVRRTFGTDTERSTQIDLSSYIDREHQTITSRTGELVWNYKQGIARINTPRSQGAAGFLSSVGSILLNDVRIESQNEFSTITVISLDGRPIKESTKLLIQAMTVERPYQFRASNGKDGRIESLGNPPFGVEKIQAKVTLQLQSGTALKTIALDENGYARNDLTVQTRANTNGALTIELPETSVYTIVQRESGSSAINWRKYGE